MAKSYDFDWSSFPKENFTELQKQVLDEHRRGDAVNLFGQGNAVGQVECGDLVFSFGSYSNIHEDYNEPPSPEQTDGLLIDVSYGSLNPKSPAYTGPIAAHDGADAYATIDCDDRTFDDCLHQSYEDFQAQMETILARQIEAIPVLKTCAEQPTGFWKKLREAWNEQDQTQNQTLYPYHDYLALKQEILQSEPEKGLLGKAVQQWRELARNLPNLDGFPKANYDAIQHKAAEPGMTIGTARIGAVELSYVPTNDGKLCANLFLPREPEPISGCYAFTPVRNDYGKFQQQLKKAVLDEVFISDLESYALQPQLRLEEKQMQAREKLAQMELTQQRLQKALDDLHIPAMCQVDNQAPDAMDATKSPHLTFTLADFDEPDYAIELSSHAVSCGEAAAELADAYAGFTNANPQDLTSREYDAICNTYADIGDAARACEEYYENGNKKAFIELKEQWKEEAQANFGTELRDLIDRAQGHGMSNKDIAKAMNRCVKEYVGAAGR